MNGKVHEAQPVSPYILSCDYYSKHVSLSNEELGKIAVKYSMEHYVLYMRKMLYFLKTIT